MGYYASGYGTVTMKEGVNLPEEIIEVMKDCFSEFEYDKHDNSYWMSFEYNKYYGDCIEDGLDLLVPYITDGVIEFVGEDAERWRFLLKDGEFVEQQGRIVYDEEE